MTSQTESPFERISRFGVRSVSAIDLLSLVLTQNSSSLSTTEHHARSWIQANGIFKIIELSPAELVELGIEDPFYALKVLSAFELGRRSTKAGAGPVEYIEGPTDVAKLFDYLVQEKKEHFCAAYLNSKNRVLCTRTIHIGTINTSLVGMREVFREAIKEGAASLIAVHNHPSGDPNPSAQDISITHKLKESGKLLGVPLLDHVIIGRQCYYSFQEKGFL